MLEEDGSLAGVITADDVISVLRQEVSGRSMLARFKRHILIFLAVLGPGFITAMVDNDSGGIYTYSQAGARWLYLPLWTLLPITVALIVTQEMCSRMGAVTGKGLSDLIREEFGLRITFGIMILLVLANLTNIMAEFAGVATALDLFGVSKFISVPHGGRARLVPRGARAITQSVEKIFLFACVDLCRVHRSPDFWSSRTGSRP